MGTHSNCYCINFKNRTENIVMETNELAATFLFFAELYHIIGHSVILFGIRSLPLRDLERVGYYFAADLLTVAFSWVVTRKFALLVAVQQVQHLYYVLNWNKSYMAKRVAFWSSLDCMSKVVSHVLWNGSVLFTTSWFTSLWP